MRVASAQIARRFRVLRFELRANLGVLIANPLRDTSGLGQRQAVGSSEQRHLALGIHGEILLGLEASDLGRVGDGELILELLQ